jgi:hypothetical protein
MVKGHVIGQVFIASHDDISRIELRLMSVNTMLNNDIVALSNAIFFTDGDALHNGIGHYLTRHFWSITDEVY